MESEYSIIRTADFIGAMKSKVKVTNLESGEVTQLKVSGDGGAVFSINDSASYLFLKYSVSG